MRPPEDRCIRDQRARNISSSPASPEWGRTRLITRLAKGLRDLHPSGFFTSEIREKGERKGFELSGLRGETGVLAHAGIQSPHRVGKYGVDINGLDEFLSSLELSPEGLVIIDEIGKMECLSERFKGLITALLESDGLLIATISVHGDGFIQRIKERPDVRIYEVTRENREHLEKEIEREVRED